MGFFITEEKELPEFSNQDANKVLKVDASGLYLQWLQETTTPAELPSQAGNSGRLLTTNGSVPSWTNQIQFSNTAGNVTTISRQTYGAASNLITTSTANTSASTSSEYGIEVLPNKISFQRFVSGSTATIGARTEIASLDASNFNLNSLGINSTGSAWVNISSRLRWNDTLYIEPTQGATTGNVSSAFNFFVGTPGTTAGDTLGRFLAERLTVASTVTTVRNTLNCLSLNGTGGSATDPAIIFGDNTTIPATSRTGIYGSDDSVFFSTGGVQRFSISNASTSITGNLIMSTPAVGVTGANGGIGVVPNNLGSSTGVTFIAGSGVYNTASTSSGIRFETFNDRTLIYARGLNVLTCERSGLLVGDEGIVNTEEAFVMKKAMRTPITDRTGNFTVSISTPIVNRILVQPASSVTITLPHLNHSWISGQQHVFIPYRDTNSGASAQVFLGTGQTAGATGIQLHIMHNSTKTVVTANNTYEIIEGGVYTCIYHHLTGTTCIWYIWIDGLPTPSVPDPLRVTTAIDFGAQNLPTNICRLQGINSGASSVMNVLLNSSTTVNFTVNDTEVQNSLRLFKAPITDWIIVDSTTHEVSRNSPSKIILTRGTTGSSNATVIFPISTNVPDGLTIQVMVWMLPDRTGTGTQRVRFDSASPTNNAFVLGSSGTGIALGGTTYTVTEGTNFTATNFRTTIGRWMVDATRFNSTPALTAA